MLTAKTVSGGRRGAAVRVVKLGGNELDRPGWLADCAQAVARAGSVVVVHGGGAAITSLSERLGLPVDKRDGLRVTTPEVAEVVEMVLAGPVNRRVVTALRAAGLDALGLAGADGGLLTAEQAPGALGLVGRVTAVRAGLLDSLLLAGLTPVVAPLAPQADGTVLNVNADDAAAAVAGALNAEELLQISDVAGVVVDGAVSATLAEAEIEGLIARGVVTGGMAAKLRAAAAALALGVRAVRIGGPALLTDPAAGTRVLATALQPA
jgi:acetylglutamate kinase